MVGSLRNCDSSEFNHRIISRKSVRAIYHSFNQAINHQPFEQSLSKCFSLSVSIVFVLWLIGRSVMNGKSVLMIITKQTEAKITLFCYGTSTECLLQNRDSRETFRGDGFNVIFFTIMRLLGNPGHPRVTLKIYFLVSILSSRGVSLRGPLRVVAGRPSVPGAWFLRVETRSIRYCSDGAAHRFDGRG